MGLLYVGTLWPNSFPKGIKGRNGSAIPAIPAIFRKSRREILSLSVIINYEVAKDKYMSYLRIQYFAVRRNYFRLEYSQVKRRYIGIESSDTTIFKMVNAGSISPVPNSLSSDEDCSSVFIITASPVLMGGLTRVLLTPPVSLTFL
jgi:hypothetical protein